MTGKPIPRDRPPLGGVAPDTRECVLHPAWLAFIRYCRELRYGELERVIIQDGLPVIAENVRQKVKFTG